MPLVVGSQTPLPVAAVGSMVTDGPSKQAGFVKDLVESDQGLALLIGAYLEILEVQTGPADPGEKRFLINLRALSKDLGNRDAMNAQYERMTLVQLDGQPWVTPRSRTA